MKFKQTEGILLVEFYCLIFAKNSDIIYTNKHTILQLFKDNKLS